MTRGRYSLREIARNMGLRIRGVSKRAQLESWPYVTIPHPGRPKRIYRLEDLPPDIQAVLMAADPPVDTTQVSGTTPSAPSPSSPDPQPDYDAEALWRWAETRPQRLRELGAQRARVIAQVERLMAAGSTFRSAAIEVSASHGGLTAATLRNWYYGRGRPGARAYLPQDRAAALIPGWSGRRAKASIPAPAWDWFKSYYLTRSQPTLTEAWRRTVETARAEGWGTLPSAWTFSRRLKSETSVPVRTFLREGPEQLARLHPPQRRDRRAIPAGQAAVGDGLKFDRIWVQWPDGEVTHTTTGWFWSDLRTGYLAAWRLAKTETTDLFRLATYDLTKLFCPERVWVDNSMVAASKAMTGRAPGRRRRRGRDTDPIGLLLQLGIDVRWVTPGSPGSKPIERTFGIGGIHEAVATHPRLAKRGYSRKTAVPYAEFAAVVAEEVHRHNQRPGRRTAVCHGQLSYEQAFEESFSASSSRRLTESQRGLLLRVPEVVTADRSRGEIRLRAGRGPGGRHRYWSETLLAHKGRKVIAYYDPESLTDPISVTTLDGRLIGRAEHLADVGFEDTKSAGEWARRRSRFRKAARRAAESERRLRESEMAALYPSPEAPPAPQPGVVVGNFSQRRRLVEGEVAAAAGGGLRRASGGYDEEDPLVSRADDLILRMGSRLRRPEEE